MKAINFLEAVERLVSLFDKGRMTREEFQVKLDKLIQFYSTPFKPEMITEYFEGWEKYFEDDYKNRARIFLTNGVDGITYDRDFYLLGKNGLAVNEWEMGDYIRFATLNDFISDCERAGIELTFKKEIADKYFK